MIVVFWVLFNSLNLYEVVGVFLIKISDRFWFLNCHALSLVIDLGHLTLYYDLIGFSFFI